MWSRKLLDFQVDGIFRKIGYFASHGNESSTSEALDLDYVNYMAIAKWGRIFLTFHCPRGLVHSRIEIFFFFLHVRLMFSILAGERVYNYYFHNISSVVMCKDRMPFILARQSKCESGLVKVNIPKVIERPLDVLTGLLS